MIKKRKDPPKTELIAELKRLFRAYPNLTRDGVKTLKKKGETDYSANKYTSVFGSWSAALETAGFESRKLVTPEDIQDLVYYKSVAATNLQKARQLEKQVGLERKIIEMAKDSLQALKPAPFRPPKRMTTRIEPSVESAVLLAGDFHVGEKIDPNEVLGLNKYDFNEFCWRIEFLVDKIVELLFYRLQGGYQFPKLYIILLGDIVSGEIHDEYRETNELSIFDSMFGAAMILAQAIRELATWFKEIEVVCVDGNHARRFREKKKKRRWDNYDHISYQVLSMFLSAQKNVKFHIPRAPILTVDIEGFSFLCSHGDEVNSYMGTPIYGINRRSASLQEILASQGTPFDYNVHGHWHSMHAWDMPGGGEKIINGSLSGTCQYALSLGLSSKPKQLLFGMHPEVGKTFAYPILLKQRPPTAFSRYQYDAGKVAGEQMKGMLT